MLISEEEAEDIEKAIERESYPFRLGDHVLRVGPLYGAFGQGIQRDKSLAIDAVSGLGKLLEIKEVKSFGGGNSHPIFKKWYAVQEVGKEVPPDAWVEFHGCELIKAESMELNVGELL